MPFSALSALLRLLHCALLCCYRCKDHSAAYLYSLRCSESAASSAACQLLPAAALGVLPADDTLRDMTGALPLPPAAAEPCMQVHSMACVRMHASQPLLVAGSALHDTAQHLELEL